MGLFIKGDIVVIPFPFSDLSGSKKRPALVVANLSGEDLIFCQITSQPYNNTYSIPLDHMDFAKGDYAYLVLHGRTNFSPEIMRLLKNRSDT